MTLSEIARAIDADVAQADRPRIVGSSMAGGGLGGSRAVVTAPPERATVLAVAPRAPDVSSIYNPPEAPNAPDLPGRGVSQWIVTWRGARYWWAPDAIPAGNQWSQGVLPESVARSLGGVRLSMPEIAHSGVAAAANRTTWGGAGESDTKLIRAPGWLFASDPKTHLARQFVPGRGTSNARAFLTEFAIPVAAATLPAVLGAVLAPAAAGAQGLQAVASTGAQLGTLGTGGGLGLTAGTAGANAAAVLGSAAAAAPAGLPGIGLTLANASGQAAAAKFAAGTSAALQAVTAAPAPALPSVPAAPSPLSVLDPFAVPASGAAAPVASAPAGAGGLLSQARAGLGVIQAQLAPIQQAAGLVSAATSLPSMLTGGVPTPAPPSDPGIDASVIDRALRAPPVTVTGRFDWSFWLALAAASALLWRL